MKSREATALNEEMPTLSDFFLIGLDHSPSYLTLPFKKKSNPDRQTDGRSNNMTT